MGPRDEPEDDGRERRMSQVKAASLAARDKLYFRREGSRMHTELLEFTRRVRIGSMR
jgi:hypothetical protein